MSINGTITAGIVLLVVAFLFVTLRCYSRFIISKSFGVDDGLVLLSFVSSIALMYCLIDGRQYYHGYQFGQPESPATQGLVRSTWGVTICFCAGSTFTKNSAILQCLRFILFGKMRIFCWVVLAGFTVLGLLSTIITIFQCQPIQAYWHRSLPGAKCFKLVAFWYIGSIGVILADVLVVAIPVMTVKKLNMPTRQKWVLIAVFAFGGIASIASIIRLQYLIRLSASLERDRLNTTPATWALIELNIGIICISIPPLKALIVRIAPFILDVNAYRHRITQSSSGVSSDATLHVELSHPRSRKSSDFTLVFLEDRLTSNSKATRHDLSSVA